MISIISSITGLEHTHSFKSSRLNTFPPFASAPYDSRQPLTRMGMEIFFPSRGRKPWFAKLGRNKIMVVNTVDRVLRDININERTC
jgi:hypothetical protein